MIRQCVPVLTDLIGLMSYLFARRIAVHLALSPSPRTKGSREVENEDDQGLRGLILGTEYVGKQEKVFVTR